MKLGWAIEIPNAKLCRRDERLVWSVKSGMSYNHAAFTDAPLSPTSLGGLAYALVSKGMGAAPEP